MAKPVPFQAYRFNPNVSIRMGSLLVAAAGPISNVILAAVCLCISKSIGFEPGDDSAAHFLLRNLVIVNISLALFNLIPVPPLDGSWIVDALLPEKWQPFWGRYIRSSVGSVVLLVVGLICTVFYLGALISAIEKAFGGF